MPSKRELLKQQARKNEMTRGAESILTEAEKQASSPVEALEIKGYEVKKEETIMQQPASGAGAADNKASIDSKANENNEASEDNITNKASINSRANENNTPGVPGFSAEAAVHEKTVKTVRTRAGKNYTGKDKNYGMRLSDNDDVEFLDFYPIQLGQKKKQYFVSLLEKEINEAFTKEINLSDPTIREYQKGGKAQLTSKNVTIAIPEDMIPDIKLAAARYRMQSQKYVAYIVKKTRINTKDYQ